MGISRSFESIPNDNDNDNDDDDDDDDDNYNEDNYNDNNNNNNNNDNDNNLVAPFASLTFFQWPYYPAPPPSPRSMVPAKGPPY